MPTTDPGLIILRRLSRLDYGPASRNDRRIQRRKDGAGAHQGVGQLDTAGSFKAVADLTNARLELTRYPSK